MNHPQPHPHPPEAPSLVQVKGLHRYFTIRKTCGLFSKKVILKAVDGIHFSVPQGRTLGIVGESGCGKSTTARILVNVDRPTSGEVFFKGQAVTDPSPAQRRRLTRSIQYVFQDPLGALDPRMKIIHQVMEPMAIHGLHPPDERRDRAAALLNGLDLKAFTFDRFPHEISGGQRQRVVLARALSLEPELLVCDEPISAIDVSLQAQVINLLTRLRDERGLTMIFISHDLSAVRHLCDTVAVMYLGKIVELAENDDLFESPRHPYTKSLLSAIPIPQPRLERERLLLKGDPPSPIDLPSGCRFHPRCPRAEPLCSEEEPEFRSLDRSGRAACHFALDKHRTGAR